MVGDNARGRFRKTRSTIKNKTRKTLRLNPLNNRPLDKAFKSSNLPQTFGGIFYVSNKHRFRFKRPLKTTGLSSVIQQAFSVLFFTEMWERFSYYGMRALLVLYMVNNILSYMPRVAGTFLVLALSAIFGEILASRPLSSRIYGLYTALVYLTPFFGGMLADRILGQRKTVYLGGILMAIGHFLIGGGIFIFLSSYFFLIFGNGCFKPNISTQVGSLYKEGDPRRDGA